MVIDGGSFGFGSLGVPSTLAHLPIVLFYFSPGELANLNNDISPWRMMDSLTRTPAPMVTPVPMETLGPNYRKTLGI
uniref:Uncharacterized protein n=1 Tax=Salmo trutta TaxID=8032 RepID=A0A674CSP0_SALTR